MLIARTRAHPHKHDGDCGRQMRQTMTAEVRVEGKSINPGTARRPTDRFGRQRPIRLTLVASAAHDFHHGGECQAAGFRPAHQPRDHFLEAQKMVGLPATGQYEM